MTQADPSLVKEIGETNSSKSVNDCASKKSQIIVTEGFRVLNLLKKLVITPDYVLSVSLF